MKTTLNRKNPASSLYRALAKTTPILSFVWASLSLCLCSCATQRVHQEVANHIIMADNNGEPVHPLTGWMEPAQYSNYLNDLVRNVKEHSPAGNEGRKKILIFVHGGLNNRAVSLRRADELYETVLTDKDDPYYPVFINWP